MSYPTTFHGSPSGNLTRGAGSSSIAYDEMVNQTKINLGRGTSSMDGMLDESSTTGTGAPVPKDFMSWPAQTEIPFSFQDKPRRDGIKIRSPPRRSFNGSRSKAKKFGEDMRKCLRESTFGSGQDEVTTVLSFLGEGAKAWLKKAMETDRPSDGEGAIRMILGEFGPLRPSCILDAIRESKRSAKEDPLKHARGILGLSTTMVEEGFQSLSAAMEASAAAQLMRSLPRKCAKHTPLHHPKTLSEVVVLLKQTEKYLHESRYGERSESDSSDESDNSS